MKIKNSAFKTIAEFFHVKKVFISKSYNFTLRV